MRIALPCLIALLGGWFLGQARAGDAPAARSFDSYQLVMLRRSDKAADIPREELAGIGKKHLAHIDAMAKRGALVLAGPLGEQDDPHWRGVCLYRVKDLASARALASEDPAVQAGAFDVVCATWYVEKGHVAFPKAPQPEEAPTTPTATGVDRSSPTALAESIFRAARSGDFAGLESIAIASSDGDSRDVAGIAKAAADHQAKFRAWFGKGRVSGEVKVAGNRAEVPIVFGPDGDREETFVMLRQPDGTWILAGF